MARKSNREHLAVSLFPFLSILACVIGVLTLMITALALGQIGEKAANQAEIDRAEEFVRLQKESAQLSPRVEHMRAALIKGKQLETQAQRIAREREELEKQKKQTQMPAVSGEELAKQAAALAAANEKMDAELKELLEDLAPLREEVAKIPDKDEQGRITVRPGGSGTNLKPVFVECAETGIVIHETQAMVVLRAGMETNAGFLAVLDRVSEADDVTIIFLVRPKGIATYNQARLIARTRHARNGKLPLPGDGPIDLSLFRGKK